MTAVDTATTVPGSGSVGARRTGRWIDEWTPEDPEFWEAGGKDVAKRNLIWSIVPELLGFSVWLLWSVSAALLTKAGFGLSSDLSLIRQRFGVEPQGVLDLDSEFRRRGYRRSVGVKTAVALVFERRFVKSRKATTSNWANRQLTDAQLRYAANDAYAAIRVFDALGLRA